MKMKGLVMFILAVVLSSAALVNAQKKSSATKEVPSSGMGSSMQSCMDQIVADSTMKMQMMSRIMNSFSGDSAGLNKFCRKILGNSDVHRTIMKMMSSEGMAGRMKEEMTHNGILNRNKADSAISKDKPLLP